MSTTYMPTWMMEKVNERYRFVQYLESKRVMEAKIARVRKFYGVDEPMDMLKAVEETWDLEDSTRREIMEYILRDIMGRNEGEVARYMEGVKDSEDYIVDFVGEIHGD